MIDTINKFKVILDLRQMCFILPEKNRKHWNSEKAKAKEDRRVARNIKTDYKSFWRYEKIFH